MKAFVLGLGTEHGVFSLTRPCRSPALGWISHALFLVWRPWISHKGCPHGHPPEKPCEDSPLQAAEGCPKLSTLLLLLEVT